MVRYLFSRSSPKACGPQPTHDLVCVAGEAGKRSVGPPGGLVMAANSLCRLWRLTSAVALAGTVILTAAGQPPPAEPQIGNWKLPKLVKSPLATPAPSDDAIQRFRKERYMAALTVALATNEGFQAGTAQGTLDRLAEAHLGLLQTEFDLRPTPAD